MGIHGLNNNPRAIPPRPEVRGIPRDLMKPASMFLRNGVGNVCIAMRKIKY